MHASQSLLSQNFPEVSRIYRNYISDRRRYYGPGSVPSPAPPEPTPKPQPRTDPPSVCRTGENGGIASGITGAIRSFLPDWLDVGDVVLLLLLFLLYLESGDEDFLIILVVVGFSVFKRN